LAKSNRSKAAKQAAQTRKFSKEAGDKATVTTKESEEFCAKEFEKMMGGKSILHGLPDFNSIKNGKVIFCEVKPYMEWNHTDKSVKDWRVVGPKRRKLRKDQLKSVKELIKAKQKVFVIYYNKEVFSKTDVRYTIHRDAGGNSNPRPVTKKMLKNAGSSDPHLNYFNGWIEDE